MQPIPESRCSVGNVAIQALKTAARLVLVLLAVTFAAFVLVDASPIDPVAAYVGAEAMDQMDPERLQRLKDYFDVGTPLLERYGKWLMGIVQGDMGTSLIYRQPVMDVIWAKVGPSLALMLTAWVLSGLLGFALGLVAGVNRDSFVDKLIKGFSLLMASVPTFWFAMLLLIIFSVWLQLFPIGLSTPIGVLSEDVSLADKAHHLILPALTLSIVGISSIALSTREKTVDILEQDFVLFAKARGDKMSSIVKNHLLRNVSLPAITLQFAAFSEIIGGSILVEQVFSYPGLGQAVVSAGLRGDAPLLLGITVVLAIMVFVGNALADVIYGLVDPRIRRSAHV